MFLDQHVVVVPKVISLVNKLHRLVYVNSFHVLSQMAVSSVGSLEQQQNVESRLAFEDLGLELHISWRLFHLNVKFSHSILIVTEHPLLLSVQMYSNKVAFFN